MFFIDFLVSLDMCFILIVWLVFLIKRVKIVVKYLEFVFCILLIFVIIKRKIEFEFNEVNFMIRNLIDKFWDDW